ncbi:LysR family transcriptional regulator [Paenibacillus contaminans]|uniref:LysR family transcriptional regulator n=1 Tax=Paenibacillus contaminans TaxID=450362 RepID=A0A329MUC5_9BACL|nr:LysR family transcriptional regulator [Paenibacillus contaminans]RAV23180.1 LysR family transcriptional regulator [Paenibacillus contaminans]
MTFQQIKYLAEVARCGSINKAAENLFVSQSSISSALKELEEEMHIKMFIRSNQGVEMTAEGRQFLSYSNSLLERKAYIESMYASNRIEPDARLSISTQRYPFAVDAFVRLINETEYSRLNFTIRETSMDNVIEDVYTSVSDVGVLFTSDLTEKVIRRVLDMRKIEFHLIKKIQPCVYVRKGHPLALKKSVKAKDLRDYMFMTFEHNQGSPVDFSEEFIFIREQPPSRTITVNDRATAVNIVCHTDAVTTGSGLILEAFMDHRITSVPLEDVGDKMRLGWIKLKNRTLSQESLLFIEKLKESIETAIACTETIRQNHLSKGI